MASVDLSAALDLAPTIAADWLIVGPVVVPIICGALLLMFRHNTRMQAGLAIAGLALAFAASIGLLWRVIENGPVVMTMGRWLPPFGISFTADLLGASFAALALFVALVCAFYSLRDIDTSGRRYGFYTFLNLMMAGVSGAFLTGDIFNLYVWFEVFLISSFGLIVLGSEKGQIDGAMKYAVLNLVGTTLFLIATGMLYGLFGTLNMADIAIKAPAMRDTGPMLTLATLYLLAFGMKAAVFPVNFWLPASYHTPRIVAGALFGGVLTKIGIYALLRVMLMIFAVERLALSGLIAWVAALTMLIGILGALAMSDIRRMTGFIVIAGVGTMIAGLAIGTEEGVAGAIFYAFHSMLCMSALYLLAGAVREAGGSFSLHDVSGLYGRLPLLAAIGFVLVLAAAGLPPASGLWPKIVLVRAALAAGMPWMAAVILLCAFITTIALGRLFILVFWREGAGNPEEVRPLTTGTYLPLVALTLPILLLGLYPQPALELAQGASRLLLSPAPYLDAVFPGAR